MELALAKKYAILAKANNKQTSFIPALAAGN